MKFSNEKPPNYEEMLAHFPLIEKFKPVFAYGDTVYNPFHVVLTPDLIYHEAVHLKQQGMDPEAWYREYLTNATFRFTQELEAYQEQYRFFSRHVKDRELVSHLLSALAEALSSALYGKLTTFSEARKLIRG